MRHSVVRPEFAEVWRLTLVGSPTSRIAMVLPPPHWRWASELARRRPPPRATSRASPHEIALGCAARRLRRRHAAAGRADDAGRRAVARAARQRPGRDRRHLRRQSAELAVHLGVDLRHGLADGRPRGRARSRRRAAQRHAAVARACSSHRRNFWTRPRRSSGRCCGRCWPAVCRLACSRRRSSTIFRGTPSAAGGCVLSNRAAAPAE